LDQTAVRSVNKAKTDGSAIKVLLSINKWVRAFFASFMHLRLCQEIHEKSLIKLEELQ